MFASGCTFHLSECMSMGCSASDNLFHCDYGLKGLDSL